MIFSYCYKKVLKWAESKFAIYYLSLISFLESCILPYPPPDVMLAPMVLKKPNNAYYLAILTTIFSVIGGVFGYLLGMFGLELIEPFLRKMHYLDKLEIIKIWFNAYGIWLVFIAGFSPIPYKLFTIMAGILSMSLIPFVLISFIARGLRFFMVAGLVKTFGNQCDLWLKKYIDRLGWIIVIIFILIGGYLYA
ncbi:FIG139438: lipoprotein B [hydrothermal vent metagenome]|uniref:FIG139438: lipoprotein B n=1 Tax=hydrothermal vent metagenome TaxID=652676 RepID=A0A1W1CMI7_9ZZZZ